VEHLIPHEWFVGQSQWLLLIIAGISITFLGKGADWLVEGSSQIAYRLGMSKIVIGATIVSLGTTSPECAVSVMAAWSGEPTLALGNAVGSIIADSGLIFGLGCVLTSLPADRFILNRQGWVQFGSGALLAVLCYGTYLLWGHEAMLERWMGLLLLGLLLAYLAVSVRWSRQHRAMEEAASQPEMGGASEEAVAEVPEPADVASSISALIVTSVVGLVFVLFSSHVLIQTVTELAVRWGVPKVVIAATLVAGGTSLPELVIGITSIVKGHPAILVGNVIGADVLNVLFVAGASAVAQPLPIVENGNPIFLYLHLPTMLIVLCMFRLFIFGASKHGRFRRWYGVPLLGLYVAYVVVQFVVSA